MTDDFEEECQDDGIDARVRILRDVMLSYDWSFLLDVRDRAYVGRLEEALGFLGLSLEASAPDPVPEGGLYRATSDVRIRLGRDARTYTGAYTASDPTSAVLMASRAAFAAAGLLSSPRPISGGIRLALGPVRM